VIGTRAAAKAPPDGYTLVMLTTGFTLPANTGYEIKDFAPIGTISSTPIVIMSHPSLPANSLADVIAMAKKDPGKISAGSPPPPDAELFRRSSCEGDGRYRPHDCGPTRGPGPLQRSGPAGMSRSPSNTNRACARQHPGRKKIKAIAVASPKRSAAAADVPTAAEAGLPGFEACSLLRDRPSAGRHAAPDYSIQHQQEMRTIIEAPGRRSASVSLSGV